MFTGLIEEIGEITAIEPVGDSLRLTVRGPKVTSDAAHGDSIQVSGVCLTVIANSNNEFTADVMEQSIKMSTLGSLKVGDRVNLERAARVDSRLGGHIVQGHVDGTGEILSRTPSEHWELVKVSLPVELNLYLVDKGSITVDGISLTVADVDAESFTVSLIPEGSSSVGPGQVDFSINPADYGIPPGDYDVSVVTNTGEEEVPIEVSGEVEDVRIPLDGSSPVLNVAGVGEVPFTMISQFGVPDADSDVA